jgi:hypothetical protein
MGVPKRALPPALAANRWKKGQSGNPSGQSGEYGQAVRLARQAAPYAVQGLIQLMDSEDERVAAVACNSILDRAFGRPRLEGEQKDSLEERVAKMTREERLARMRELLDSMRRYLPTAEQEAAAMAAETVEIGRYRRRRPSAA